MGDKCHNDIVDSHEVDNVSSASRTYPSSGNTFCRTPGSSCQALRHAVAALSRLDDFVCEKIGSGFFSEVFKVRHRTTEQVMVLKMNMSHSNRSNMLREVQLMNRLSHPNILRFMGVCVHEGQLHALTEYLNGGSLEQLILNKKKELSWTARIKIALDVARGMCYLHSRGVFHRDLTSKNVLIKEEGAELTAVVGDFGLAERIPDLRHNNRRLPIVGSPYWMAPECLHGQWYNEMADVFSYGIILCEMIGRIEADPDVLPRTENFGVDYVAFSKLCPNCPFQFLTLAFSCCAIDPKNRPSFKDIVHQLEMFLVDRIDGSYILQNKILSPSYDDADSIDNVQAIFAHWHKRSVEMSSSECEEAYPERIEQSRKSIEGPHVVPVTAIHIGEFMSQQDPHYKPFSTTQNPFASLTCFNGGRKILGESSKGGESDFSLSCSFELPSPSCALTPPGTPVTPDELLCSSASGHRRVSSHSLPASPTLLRRTLVRMHSGRSDISVDPTAVSPYSVSPEPPSSVSSTSPTETEENPFLASIRSNLNPTNYSSLHTTSDVTLSAKTCCPRESNGHCIDERCGDSSGSSITDDAVSWCRKISKKTDNFLSPPEISSRFASGRKRPSSYHSDDSGCCCSSSTVTGVYVKEIEGKTNENLGNASLHMDEEQNYAEREINNCDSIHISSDVNSIQPEASSLCESNDIALPNKENASLTPVDNCTFNGGLNQTISINRTAKLLKTLQKS